MSQNRHILCKQYCFPGLLLLKTEWYWKSEQFILYLFLPFLYENTLRIWQNRIKYNSLQAPFCFRVWLLLLPWRDTDKVPSFILSQNKTKLKYSLGCQLLTHCESPDTAGVQVFGKCPPQFPLVCGQWQWKGSGWGYAAVSVGGDCWGAALGDPQWSTRWNCSPPHPDAVLHSLCNTKIGVDSELSLIIKKEFLLWKARFDFVFNKPKSPKFELLSNLEFPWDIAPSKQMWYFYSHIFSLVGIMLFWINMQLIAFTNFTNPISVKFKSLYVISSIVRITTETLLHAWRSGVSSCVRSQLA